MANGAAEIILKQSIRLAHPEYMYDSGALKWDLKIDKKAALNVGYGAGRFLRAIKAFEMYWHAEGMKNLSANVCSALLINLGQVDGHRSE